MDIKIRKNKNIDVMPFSLFDNIYVIKNLDSLLKSYKNIVTVNQTIQKT